MLRPPQCHFQKIIISIAAWSSDREQLFLRLPLRFVAQSRPEASVDSSAAVPVSGSLVGRNPSRVLCPQLVPGHTKKDRL